MGKRSILKSIKNKTSLEVFFLKRGINMTKEEQNMRIRSLFVNPKELLKNENHSILFLVPNEEVGNRILTSYTKEVASSHEEIILFENGESQLCEDITDRLTRINLNKIDFTDAKRTRFITGFVSRRYMDRAIYPNIVKEDLQSMLYLTNAGYVLNGTYCCSSFDAFIETMKKHVEHWERLYGCIDYYVEISEKGNIRKIYEGTFKGINLLYYKRD